MMKEYITPKLKVVLVNTEGSLAAYTWQSGEAGAREIDLDGWDNEAFDTEPNNAE